jgi:succinylglutamate desuccinylase
MLNEVDFLPEGLLDTRSGDLYKVLPGPTLLHLQGRMAEPLFVSVLLHGNEYSGWEAMRRFLYSYQRDELPRSISVFIGNIQAARYGIRHLDGQPDYNRVWNGTETAEHKMMQAVLDAMNRRRVFASIDLHNNTGRNPHYACINKTENRFIQLARMFSRIIVYFIRPDGVQAKAFAGLCPAVTLECGQPGESSGIDHAIEYLEKCINMETIPDQPMDRSEIDLYHTIGVTKIKQGVSLGFNGENADLVLAGNIESMNMKEIAPENIIAEKVSTSFLPLTVMDEQGNDVTSEHFTIRDGKLLNRKQIIPSMFTLNKDIIIDDCLCYLMEHYQLNNRV